MYEHNNFFPTLHVGVVRVYASIILSSSFSFFIIIINDYNDYCTLYWHDAMMHHA